MMDYLIHIPIAFLNNIGFMAILYVLYECMKWTGYFKPAQLFHLAVFVQIIGLTQFLFAIIKPDRLFFLNLTAQIHNLQISLNAPILNNGLFIIGLIYLSVVAYFLVKIIVQLSLLNRLKKSANFNDANQFDQYLPEAIKFNKTKVKIGMSDQINTPITFGWLSPIILLPIALCNQLSPKELETILIHEIAHIIRKDYILNIIMTLHQILLFFNPFSILFNKEISLQREIACDMMVIQSHRQKIHYMNALLKIAEFALVQPAKKTAFTLGIFGNKNELLARIEYFNHMSKKSYKQLAVKLLLGLMLGGFMLLSIYPYHEEKYQNKDLQKKSITQIQTIQLHTTHSKIDKYKKYGLQKKQVHEKHHHDLQNESYAGLVQQTQVWIKQHESPTQFATYDDEFDQNSYNTADKLLIRAIFSNYQLKRDLLNQKLAKANNLKEALDYLIKSEELDQIKQYEKWTKEFILTHPKIKDTTSLQEPIIY